VNIAQPQATEQHKSKHIHSYMRNTGNNVQHTGSVSLEVQLHIYMDTAHWSITPCALHKM